MILLDTCALLELQAGSSGFSPAARLLLEAPDIPVFVSAITAFEIGQKVAIGKLSMSLPTEKWFHAMIDHYSLELLSITASHALSATALPQIHRDPFDRILIATALEHKLTILTCDRIIPTYPKVKTLW